MLFAGYRTGRAQGCHHVEDLHLIDLRELVPPDEEEGSRTVTVDGCGSGADLISVCPGRPLQLVDKGDFQGHPHHRGEACSDGLRDSLQRWDTRVVDL